MKDIKKIFWLSMLFPYVTCNKYHFSIQSVYTKLLPLPSLLRLHQKQYRSCLPFRLDFLKNFATVCRITHQKLKNSTYIESVPSVYFNSLRILTGYPVRKADDFQLMHDLDCVWKKSWRVLVVKVFFIVLTLMIHTKGQLISKRLFGVSNFPKKRTWKLL